MQPCQYRSVSFPIASQVHWSFRGSAFPVCQTEHRELSPPQFLPPVFYGYFRVRFELSLRTVWHFFIIITSVRSSEYSITDIGKINNLANQANDWLRKAVCIFSYMLDFVFPLPLFGRRISTERCGFISFQYFQIKRNPQKRSVFKGFSWLPEQGSNLWHHD